jgi:hypothetical protein
MLALTVGLVGIALLVAFMVTGRALLRSYEAREPYVHPPAIDPALPEMRQAIESNAHEIDRLRLAVADGIERVDRAEKRVRKTVYGARKLLSDNGIEHAALEAEVAEIRERDGEASEQVELPEVQPDVEPDRPTGIPGVSRAHLARLRETVSA